MTRSRWIPMAAGLCCVVMSLAAPSLAAPSNAATTAPSKAIKYPEPTLSSCKDGMSSVTSAHFVVWACKDMAATATREEKKALELAENLYAPMTSYMGGGPADNYGPTGAGDTTSKTDIYLVYNDEVLHREDVNSQVQPVIASCEKQPDGDLGAAQPDPATFHGPGAVATSGYIVVSRSLLERCSADFTSVLAHEFFHVLAMRYNATLTCPDFWFDEASADWAEWYFAPATADAMVYPDFTDFQARAGVSLTDSENGNQYGAFVWPMFMQQKTGNAAAVANAWRAMAGKKGCAAFNSAIDAQASFAKDFDAFAVEDYDSELPNASPLGKGWPIGFGPRFQETHPLKGTAPEFPEQAPKTTTVNLPQPLPQPPWKHTTTISLPPLSASYVNYPYYSASMEFDFSGLSPPADIGITLFAADSGNKAAYLTVPVTGNQVKFCFAADNSGAGTVLAIVDNHDMKDKVTGSYTVTASSACAASLSGTLGLKVSTDDDGTETTQTATIDGTYVPNADGWWDIEKGSTYSATYKTTVPDFCDGGPLVISGQGSGVLKNWPDADVVLEQAYMNAYSVTPLIALPALSQETATATATSPCGSSTETVELEIFPDCPLPLPAGAGPQMDGKYTTGDKAINFDCSAQVSENGSSATITNTGSLTATDPIPCGLWTPGCPAISPRTAAARQPARQSHTAGD
jgi:hypothetical protein